MHICAYAGPWSSDGIHAKRQSTFAGHSVAFADAGTVLHDEQAITISDEGSDAEERFVALGMDALGRILVVAYTWRDERPRLISSRKAIPRERRQYEGAR